MHTLETFKGVYGPLSVFLAIGRFLRVLLRLKSLLEKADVIYLKGLKGLALISGSRDINAFFKGTIGH